MNEFWMNALAAPLFPSPRSRWRAQRAASASTLQVAAPDPRVAWLRSAARRAVGRVGERSEPGWGERLAMAKRPTTGTAGPTWRHPPPQPLPARVPEGEGLGFGRISNRPPPGMAVPCVACATGIRRANVPTPRA